MLNRFWQLLKTKYIISLGKDSQNKPLMEFDVDCSCNMEHCRHIQRRLFNGLLINYEYFYLKDINDISQLFEFAPVIPLKTSIFNLQMELFQMLAITNKGPKYSHKAHLRARNLFNCNLHLYIPYCKNLKCYHFVAHAGDTCGHKDCQEKNDEINIEK